MNDKEIEELIQEKGLTKGVRVTPEDIENTIVAEQYHVFPGTTVTVCCLTLRNGFNTVGESSCIDPDNFDAEVGQDIARQNAEDKIWALEGYRLASVGIDPIA